MRVFSNLIMALICLIKKAQKSSEICTKCYLPIYVAKYSH